jgi:NifU-like protein involved in Fe-S cluster formation
VIALKTRVHLIPDLTGGKMSYSDKVIDHYNNPRNVGSLDKKAPNVGTGLVGAPECGK